VTDRSRHHVPAPGFVRLFRGVPRSGWTCARWHCRCSTGRCACPETHSW